MFLYSAITLSHLLASASVEAVLARTEITSDFAFRPEKAVLTRAMHESVVDIVLPKVLVFRKGLRVTFEPQLALAVVLACQSAVRHLALCIFTVLPLVIITTLTRMMRLILAASHKVEHVSRHLPVTNDAQQTSTHCYSQGILAFTAIDTKDRLIITTRLRNWNLTVLSHVLDTITIYCIVAITKLLLVTEPVQDARNALSSIVALVVLILATNVGEPTLESSQSVWAVTMESIVTYSFGVNVERLSIRMRVCRKVRIPRDAGCVVFTLQVAFQSGSVVCCQRGAARQEDNPERQSKTGSHHGSSTGRLQYTVCLEQVAC